MQKSIDKCVIMWYNVLQKERETKMNRGTEFERNRKIMIKNNPDAKCEECGATINLELHHIVPVACGGSNEQSNLKVLCHKCHANQPAHAEAIKTGQKAIRSGISGWINLSELYARLEIALSNGDYGADMIFDEIENCKVYENTGARNASVLTTIERLKGV